MTWRRQSNLTRPPIRCTLSLQATNIIITGAAGGCNGMKINETDMVISSGVSGRI